MHASYEGLTNRMQDLGLDVSPGAFQTKVKHIYNALCVTDLPEH